MNKETFKKIDALYREAISMNPDQQSKLLTDLRKVDAKLADYLAQMLTETEHDQIQDLIQNNASEMIEDRSAGSIDQTVGESLGPYQVTDIIGRGGMGAVYLAERNDESFNKKVAIKKIRMGMDDASTRARFLRERQILASLDHPGLARLLDGGTDAQGTPYVVMDYVEGHPISIYCQQHKLLLKDRLKLFIDLCRTVHFVHRNLIIHRDIKPANVLVTHAGEVKLLDFGIAKLLNHSEAEQQTQTGQQALTPEYASPEQIMGETVSTASDVFSLGALLYELITGKLIIDNDSSDSRRGSRLLLHKTPTAPSHIRCNLENTGIELNHQIAQDLDKIVLMALRQEPHRRYSSAAALADDLQRYLKNLPVEAQTDSLGYRTSKFVKRNKWSVVAFGLAFTTSISLAIFSFLQARNLTIERDRAVLAEQSAIREATTATQTSRFIIDLFNASNPRHSGNQFLTARDLLDEGLNRLKTQIQGDSPLNNKAADESIADPAVRAQLLRTIGFAYTALDVSDPAVAAMQLAMAETEKAYGSDSIEAAEIYNRMGDILREADRPEDAEPFLFKSLEMKKKILGENHIDVADSYNNIGIMLVDQNRLDEALAYQTAAVDTWRSIVGEGHVRLATPLYNLALLKRRLGQYHDALDLTEQTLSVIIDDVDLTNKCRLLKARLWREIGYPEKAQPLLEQALEVALPIYGRFKGQALIIQREIALNLTMLGEFDRAAETFQSITNDSQSHPVSYGLFLQYRGLLKQAQGEPQKALGYFQKCLDVLTQYYIETKTGAHRLPVVRQYMAAALIDLEQWNEAEQNIQKVLDELPLKPGQTDIRVGQALLQRARIMSEAGQYKHSTQLLSDAKAHILAARMQKSPEMADYWLIASQVLSKLGKDEAAKSHAQIAHDLFAEFLGHTHWKTQAALQLL